LTKIRLGLSENWQQFTLLVLVNIFVGAMVGLERTVVPLLAAEDFGLVSRTVILSFLISFGVVKAITNLFAGRPGDKLGRKPVLMAGWLIALPISSIANLDRCARPPPLSSYETSRFAAGSPA
jgi:MFS family permease